MACLGWDGMLRMKRSGSRKQKWLNITYVTCDVCHRERFGLVQNIHACKTWTFGWLKWKTFQLFKCLSHFWTLGVFPQQFLGYRCWYACFQYLIQVLKVCWGWSHRWGWSHWIATHVPKPGGRFKYFFYVHPYLGKNLVFFSLISVKFQGSIFCPRNDNSEFTTHGHRQTWWFQILYL